MVVVTLQSIRDDVDGPWNDDSRKLAGSLFNACSEFSFIICLVVTNFLLGLLQPLTSKLQGREVDIMAAYGEVDLVKNGLQRTRNEVEKIHTELYDRAQKVADYVGVQPNKPRTCARMANRENHNIVSTSDYYRSIVTIPFLDHLITEIDERFGNAPATVVKGFNAIPAIFLGKELHDLKAEFLKFVNQYATDFPISILSHTESASLQLPGCLDGCPA